MRKSVKTAFATLPPEDLLLDYVRRLARHRKGRWAVHLKLSRLTPAYRHPQDLRAAEGPFRALLEQHEGELVCLRNGDLVCCAKAPRARFDAAVLRVLYMLRDDANLRRAIEHGEEDDFLCGWYDLEKNYDALQAFVRATANASGQPANTRSGPRPPEIETERRAKAVRMSAESAPAAGCETSAVPAGSAVAIPPAALRRRLDAEQLVKLERSLARADISRFLRSETIASLESEDYFRPVLRRHYIDFGALARVITPGIDLTAEPWLYRRLATLLAKRLLSVELALSADRGVGQLLDVTTDCVGTEIFDRALRRANGIPGCVTAAFEAAEVFANPERYLEVLRGLRDRGLCSAITGLGTTHFVMREEALLPADYDGLSWPALKSTASEGDAKLEAVLRTLRRRDPERVFLEDCDEARAVEFGREIGLRLFSGIHVDSRVTPRG